ncbi:ferric-dicitrate binding protein FerR (iron transport regulator) [Filimonas zeae]|nr:FecR family protein [Filimonas zeae]MDR6338590.1 ferric-dicitrate binding protein FerR (iron transport regulator) [Filimonas zeae]
MRTETMPYSSNTENQSYAGLFSGVSPKVKSNKARAPFAGIKAHHIWWGVGVSAVALLSVTGYIFRKDIYNNMHPVVMQQLSTGVGQRKLIKLADGTQVWISPGSTLQYPQTFNREKREITITGEVFIKVAPSATHPFVIHSNGIATQTDGEADFTVQAYGNEAYAAVTMVKGNAAVAVTDTASSTVVNSSDLPADAVKQTMLQANERAIFVREELVIVKQKFASADRHMQGRVNGSYEFWGMPAVEVLKEVQRQYSEPVELRGNYYNCKYYGELKAQAPLEKFLKLFAESINAGLTKEDGVWIVNTKGCSK